MLDESSARDNTQLPRSILEEQIGVGGELPDGRLKLIDGHLRASMDAAQEVDVEVLDVNDAEARALLKGFDMPFSN